MKHQSPHEPTAVEHNTLPRSPWQTQTLPIPTQSPALEHSLAQHSLHCNIHLLSEHLQIRLTRNIQDVHKGNVSKYQQGMKTHKLKTCDIIEHGMYYVVGQKISVYTTTLPRVIYTFTVISRRLTDSPPQNYEPTVKFIWNNKQG